MSTMPMICPGCGMRKGECAKAQETVEEAYECEVVEGGHWHFVDAMTV